MESILREHQATLEFRNRRVGGATVYFNFFLTKPVQAEEAEHKGNKEPVCQL